MTALSARIEGVAVVGPGMADWAGARAILAGAEAFVASPTVIPAAEALPPTERRRAGKCVRLALHAGLAAARDAAVEARDLVAVFASSTGDGDNLHAICEDLASDDRLISPTRFHNSVHNAPSGYWGIATGAHGAADSLAAYDASFGAGLLEALGRLAADPARRVLLVSYDAPYPQPLAATRPLADAFAVGLVLAHGEGLTVETSRDAPTAMDDPALESVRAGIPAARCLPLLQALALGQPGPMVLGYLDDLSLRVALRP